MPNCPKLTTKEECIEKEMCGWNDTTNKCRKKSIRNVRKLTKPEPQQTLKPKPKETKCPDFNIEADCITNESCSWNDMTGKCRKKSIRYVRKLTKPEPQQTLKPKPKETKCPDFNIEADCITNESCSWNDTTNKCRKKSVRKLKESVVPKMPKQTKPTKPKEPVIVPKPKPKLGIRIGETTINRLSGPTSLYYLKPSSQVPQKDLHLFPSIMLFGDYHFEKTQTCVKCNCYKDITDIYQLTEILHEISGGWKSQEASAQKFLQALIVDDHRDVSIPIFSKMDPQRITAKYRFPIHLATSFVEKCRQNIRSPYRIPSPDASCCYTISDRPFLQLIDTLASRYPIDFYIETAFLGSGNGFTNGFMEDLTTGEFVSCYHRTIRGTPFDKCPTNHIRWHACDSRLMSIYTESPSFPDPIIKNIIKESKITISEKYLNYKYIEPQIAHMITLLFWTFHSTKHKHISNEIVYRSKLLEYEQFTIFRSIQNFIDFLLDAIQDTQDTQKINIHKLTHTIFEMMNIKNSIIYKQIVKQTYTPFREKSYWEELFTTTIEKNGIIDWYSKDSLSNLAAKTKIPELGNITKIIEDCRNNTIDEATLNNLVKFFSILKLFCDSFFLEMYTITRLLKQPDGGRRSSLSFMYLGDHHIQNIKNLLVNTGIYNLDKAIEARPQSGQKRCIEINFSLRVEDELIIRE
jgi:hypothetical protein